MRQEDDGLLFAGNVMVRNRRIAGSGFYDIGNTTALSIKSDSEKKQRPSKRKESYGQPLDSITIKKPSELKLKLNTFDRQNLAMALMGESAVLADSAAKITDEVLTIGKKGQWYALSLDNLDGSKVSLKNAAGQPVKTEHFEVNANLGLICIKPDCDNVQEGEEIKATATGRSGGGFRIDAETAGDFDLEIMLDGVNRVNGRNIKLHIPSAVIAADSELDWFAEDFNEASFTGTPVKLTEYPSSYSYREFGG